MKYVLISTVVAFFYFFMCGVSVVSKDKDGKYKRFSFSGKLMIAIFGASVWSLIWFVAGLIVLFIWNY